MKKCLLAMLIASPLAWAQAPAYETPYPADPVATVPRVAYRSVFADTPTGVETELADWKKANADVGQFRRGHVDILQWEAEQARRAGTAAPPAAHPHSHGGKP